MSKGKKVSDEDEAAVLAMENSWTFTEDGEVIVIGGMFVMRALEKVRHSSCYYYLVILLLLLFYIVCQRIRTLTKISKGLWCLSLQLTIKMGGKRWTCQGRRSC